MVSWEDILFFVNSNMRCAKYWFRLVQMEQNRLIIIIGLIISNTFKAHNMYKRESKHVTILAVFLKQWLFFWRYQGVS